MTVVLQVIAPRLLGPALMLAAAIIVKGYTDVGDGFSAGVIVGLAVALRYLTGGAERAERAVPILRHAQGLMVAGMLIALASGFFGVLGGDPPFTHAPGPGEDVIKFGTFELITAVAFDLGVFLLVAGGLVLLVRNLSRLVEEGIS